MTLEKCHEKRIKKSHCLSLCEVEKKQMEQGVGEGQKKKENDRVGFL